MAAVNDAQKPIFPDFAEEPQSDNSLTDNTLSSVAAKWAEKGGNEGGVITPVGTALKSTDSVPTCTKNALEIAEAEVVAVKLEVVKECRRMLREARRNIEIKNVSDFHKITNLCLEMLGATKECGKVQPLIQVNLLSDSGRRDPQTVRVIQPKTEGITESANDSPVIEAQGVEV